MTHRNKTSLVFLKSQDSLAGVQDLILSPGSSHKVSFLEAKEVRCIKAYKDNYLQINLTLTVTRGFLPLYCVSYNDVSMEILDF